MPVEIELDGIGDLVEQLQRMSDKSSRAISEALNAAAQPVLNDAKRTVAFVDRTGTLRKGLMISGVKNKKTQKYVLVGTLGKDAFYGRMVEYGTSRAAPHPFLQPAFEQNKKEIADIISNKLREALDGL